MVARLRADVATIQPKFYRPRKLKCEITLDAAQEGIVVFEALSLSMKRRGGAAGSLHSRDLETLLLELLCHL